MAPQLTRLATLNATRTSSPPRPRLRPRGLPPALEPHEVYVATNPADAALQGRDLLGAHRVRADAADGRDFVASFHAVLVRDVTLGYLDYSVGVVLELDELPPHHLVIVPATGTSTVTVGDTSIETSPVQAAVPPPGSRVRLECGRDTAHLVLRIDRSALRLHLSRLLGRSVDQPVEFEPSFDLVAPSASRWSAAIQMLHAELYETESLLHRGVGLSQIEEFVMSALLYSQRSNYSDLLTSPRHDERRAVRAAKEYIERHLAEPLTVDDIATAVGTSVRTLQHQFSEDLQQTPTAYLRNRRLERARDDLADAVPGGAVTVTDVATRWGINHLGRFSASYRERFGEPPSATLRR